MKRNKNGQPCYDGQYEVQLVSVKSGEVLEAWYVADGLHIPGTEELEEAILEHEMPLPEFVDAQAKAKENPDTFDAPDIQELQSKIHIGDFVKVCAYEERFWCEVTHTVGQQGQIHAKVANVLIADELKLNDVVIFNLFNVYDYMSKEDMDTTDDESTNLRGVHDYCN